MLDVLILTFLLSHVESAELVRRTFASTAQEYGVFSRVALTSPPHGERGLFVTESVKPGEPLLAVPWSLCLVSDAQVTDPSSPWDAPLRHGHDTLLAQMLLEHLSSDDNSEVSGFWRGWASLLPARRAMAHPLTLPAHLCDELQDAELSNAVALQQARVAHVLSGSSRPKVDVESLRGATDAEVRGWAVAMCSSRPFCMPVPPAAGQQVSDPQRTLTAFVPFIDMANHDVERANCEVQGRGGGGGEYGAVGLVATRELEAGEEAIISYFSGYTNAYCFSKFGFVPLEPNRHDRLGLPLEQLAPISVEAVRDAMSAHPERWEGAGVKAYQEATLLSLPITRDPSTGAAADADAASAVGSWLRRRAERDFSTSLEDDEAVMAEAEAGAGAAAEEPLLRAIIAYRIERKRLWKVAAEIVAAIEEHARRRG